MLDKRVLRVGAVAAMVGAVIAVVFNLLHPMADEFTAAESVALTEEGIWSLDHYMLAWAVGLALVAFIVIGRSFSSEPAASWGRVALYFGIGSVTIAFATLTVDGFALREAAEVSGPAVAESVAYVAEGLFVGLIGSFFGLTPILFGVAVLSGDDYPGWMGWVAVFAGTVGLVAGSIIFFDGFSSLTIEVLFPIASLLFTVWIGVMGFLLWQKASAPAGEPAAQPAG